MNEKLKKKSAKAALPALKHALAIYEKALGPEHPYTATGLNNLAELYRTRKYELAEPLYQRALAIKEQLEAGLRSVQKCALASLCSQCIEGATIFEPEW